MKIERIIQNNNVNTLKDEFLKNSNTSLKKMYVFLGSLKESGFDILEECLIDNKSKKAIYFGYDRKNTTKKMLDIILKYTKQVFIYNNNQVEELYSNIWIFEYMNEAYIYLLSGTVTESSLSTDIHICTKLVFDMTDTLDKKTYQGYVSGIEDELKNVSFEKLTPELVDSLMENKEIFSTKQYVYNVPSLNDLINNGTIKKAGFAKVESAMRKEEELEDLDDVSENSYADDGALPHVELDDLEDVSFDIDISDVEEQVEEKTVEKPSKTKKNTTDEKVELDEKIDIEFGKDKEYVIPSEGDVFEESDKDFEDYSGVVLDMEKEIFSSETVKVDKKKIASKVKKKKADENISKKIDLSKVSNLIMELGAKPTKGNDVAVIKVPNYIKEMLPTFFEALNGAKIIEKDRSKVKETNIDIELVDVNENKKYIDKDAKLFAKVGQTYIAFSSKLLEDIKYVDGDIIRIIKLAKNSYHIEIIPQEIDEYEFWKKLCTQNFRSSSKTYGVM